MTTNSTVKCPKCKQDNAPDMVFCIYCGEQMKARGPISGKFAAVEADDDLVALICPKCDCADPLNADYCIICGGRIPQRKSPKGVTSSVMVRSELMSLREEISTLKEPNSLTNFAKPAARIPLFLTLSVIAIIGLSLGALAGNYQLRLKGKELPPLQLPPGGLAILSAVPFSDVFIEFQEKSKFIIGRTASNGDLALISLTPEKYKVEVTSPTGDKQFHTEATVFAGKPTVLGGPPGFRLLADADQANK